MGDAIAVDCPHAALDDAPKKSRQGAASAGHCVRMPVRDTDDGMTAEVLARFVNSIFTTKVSDKGPGLCMIFGFEHRNSGSLVDIEIAEGHGTTVTLCIARVGQGPAAHGGTLNYFAEASAGFAHENDADGGA